MIAEAFLFLLISVLSICISAWELQLLLRKKITFLQALKTYSVAIALNRILLTGSGYAASSLKLKSDKVPLYMALASFAIIEAFSIAPWLGAGFYFGARVGRDAPLMIAGILCLAGLSLWLMRRKISDFLKKLFGHLREIKFTIFLILPLLCLNFLLGISAYCIFFKLFGIELPLSKLIKIISIPFTLGYLSFLPSGVGIKDGGIVFMLMRENIPLAKAISFAVADRAISTGLYLALGLFFGVDLLREELVKRFKTK